MTNLQKIIMPMKIYYKHVDLSSKYRIRFVKRVNSWIYDLKKPVFLRIHFFKYLLIIFVAYVNMFLFLLFQNIYLKILYN